MREAAFACLVGLIGVPFLLGAAAAPSESHHELFHFTDVNIVESSGLVVQDGLFYTINDSGDSARVFAVDPTTGATVGVTRWSSREPIDVESLAPAGKGEVWVGDTGGNNVSRDTVTVARVPVGRGDSSLDAPTYTLAYPDGDHDAETLVSDPVTGRLYVGTKNALGDQLYAAPEHLSADGPNRLTPFADILPIATDGAFFPDGKHLIIRNYLAATVYDFPSMQQVTTLRLPAERQGEGIAVDAAGDVYLSSEGLHSPVLRLPLPDSVRDVVTPPGPSPTPAPTYAPPATVDSTPYTTQSQAGHELPETTVSDRPVWPWFLSAILAVGFMTVLMRSLRRR